MPNTHTTQNPISAGNPAALKATCASTPDPLTPACARIQAALEGFDRLPDSAHVRLPVVAAWRGISPATVWRHVKAGLIPQPVKLGPNTTAWNVGALRSIKV